MTKKQEKERLNKISEALQFAINAVSACGVGKLEEIKQKGECLIYLHDELKTIIEEQGSG